jgi:hypothetical protein
VISAPTFRPSNESGPLRDAQRAGRRQIAAGRAGGLGRRRQLEAEPDRDGAREIVVDVAQVGHHPGSDRLDLAPGQLEDQRLGEVALLHRWSG